MPYMDGRAEGDPESQQWVMDTRGGARRQAGKATGPHRGRPCTLLPLDEAVSRQKDA